MRRSALKQELSELGWAALRQDCIVSAVNRHLSGSGYPDHDCGSQSSTLRLPLVCCRPRFISTEKRSGDQLVTMVAAGSVTSRSRLVSAFTMGARAPAIEMRGVLVSGRLH